MKRMIYFLATVCLLLNPIVAQELSGEEVLANLEERSDTLTDASFLMTGKLVDTDGQEFPLEVTMQVIPAEGLLRAEFEQPDAIADNVLLIDNDGVYSYNFLTNQVSIFNLGDSEAFGGLLPSAKEGSSYQFSLNLADVFAGWDTSLEGFADGIYSLRFDNKEKEIALISHVDTKLSAETWLPDTLLFYNADEQLIAELIFSDFAIDPGLDPEDLRTFEDDAEILDER
jgi:outer membrane lipoprotein-sorting protein